MIIKRVILLTVSFLLAQSVWVFGNSGLRIYLPREAKLEKEVITLGDISVIKGDQAMVDKAGAIAVGKFSMPFQSMGFSRAMILGRLASNGFAKKDITITGAEKIVISRQSNIIKADELIKTAKAFLKESMPSDSVNHFEQAGVVQDIELPGNTGSVKIVPSLCKSDSSGKVKVNVTIMSSRQKIAGRQIEFRQVFSANKIVATDNIKQGQVLSAENTQVTENVEGAKQSSKLQQPYGLIARRNIYAGNVITEGMIDSPAQKIVIKRNDNVAVTINKNGLFMQAIGKSLEQGRVGDFIKVRMQISNLSRVIYAQVKADGTVEPLM